MARPKFYRDPVHVQIRYERVDTGGPCPSRDEPERRLSWLIRRLIDTGAFQRLRHIRQNGLTNLVFHGAEHSRFTHSVGVAYLAGEMFDRIVRNCGEAPDPDVKIATCVAALLHDVGHGPFSHTLEEIFKKVDIKNKAESKFDHEVMTQRIVEEPVTEIQAILSEVDPALPSRVASYIGKKSKAQDWWFKLVSSQLDADRLDYLHRDARCAGLLGGFDLPRLLDSLQQLDGQRLAVDRGALETVEAYLITLDQMYRVVYYHHAVRAASVLLSSTLRRAFVLHRDGDDSVFPVMRRGVHPLRLLMEHGHAIELPSYLRLGEHQVWALIEDWQYHDDRVLSDLSRRLMARRLFKTVEIKGDDDDKEDLVRRAQELACKALSLDEEAVGYYVCTDNPSRTSYKRYDWRSTKPDESIWMVGGGQPARAIENEEQSEIVHGVRRTRFFPRLVFPEEIRAALQDEIRRRGEG